MLIREPDRLRLLVDPNWRKAVSSADHAYIEATIADFSDRARSDWQALFEQASSLSVGPLVTHETGALGADTRLSPLLSHLVEMGDLDGGMAPDGSAGNRHEAQFNPGRRRKARGIAERPGS